MPNSFHPTGVFRLPLSIAEERKENPLTFSTQPFCSLYCTCFYPGGNRSLVPAALQDLKNGTRKKSPISDLFVINHTPSVLFLLNRTLFLLFPCSHPKSIDHPAGDDSCLSRPYSAGSFRSTAERSWHPRSLATVAGCCSLEDHTPERMEHRLSGSYMFICTRENE